MLPMLLIASIRKINKLVALVISPEVHTLSPSILVDATNQQLLDALNYACGA
ncbi:hypothetical protein RYX36_011524 [Vicia faba]